MDGVSVMYDADEELPWEADARRRRQRQRRRRAQVARGFFNHRRKKVANYKRPQGPRDAATTSGPCLGEQMARRRRHEGRTTQMIVHDDLVAADGIMVDSGDSVCVGGRIKKFNRLAVA